MSKGFESGFLDETKSLRFSANERMGAKGVAPRLMACDFQVFRMGFDMSFWI